MYIYIITLLTTGITRIELLNYSPPKKRKLRKFFL